MCSCSASLYVTILTVPNISSLVIIVLFSVRDSLCLSRSLCLVQSDSVFCVVRSTLYNKDAFSFDAWIHIESFLSPINQNSGNHMGISCQCGEQTANKLFNFFKRKFRFRATKFTKTVKDNFSLANSKFKQRESKAVQLVRNFRTQQMFGSTFFNEPLQSNEVLV